MASAPLPSPAPLPQQGARTCFLHSVEERVPVTSPPPSETVAFALLGLSLKVESVLLLCRGGWGRSSALTPVSQGTWGKPALTSGWGVLGVSLTFTWLDR